MKKVLAMVVALLMVCALAVPAFAEEIVVFDNPDGQAWDDLANPWDFFGTDGYWGRQSASCLSVTWADIKPIMEAGGATFTYVYMADGAGTPNLNLTFNGDSAGNGVAAPFTVVDLGDGKFEATLALDDMVKLWNETGLTLDDAEAFLVQVWTGSFKLVSAKFSTGADAAAPAPSEEAAPAEDTTAPAEDTTAPSEEAAPAETPANTGIVLAVLPMAIAAAAVVASKRR